MGREGCVVVVPIPWEGRRVLYAVREKVRAWRVEGRR